MENKKTVLITGATEGIGKATALGLANSGFNVILHGRSETKILAVKSEIESKTSAKVDYVIADLSSLKQVKSMAEQVKAKYLIIDVLINNAGLMSQEKKMSSDGFELNFAVNYLAHFLLTILLLDNIKAAADGRIIHLSSSLYSGGKSYLEDLNWEKRPYSLMDTYNTSKLFNLYFSIELAERLAGTNAKSYAIHPGVVNSQLARDFKGVLGLFFSIVTKLFFVSAEKGASTSIYLATSPHVMSKSGKYFEDKKEVAIKVIGNNVGNRKKLWEISEALVKKAIG